MSARVVSFGRSAVVTAAALVLGCGSTPEPAPLVPPAVDRTRAGTEALARGDLAAAAVHLERALELARTVGDRAGECDAQLGLGAVLETVGRLSDARDRYVAARTAALPESERNDAFVAPYWPGAAAASANLARVALTLGLVDEAQNELEAARLATSRTERPALDGDVARLGVLVQLARGFATDDMLRDAEGLVRHARGLGDEHRAQVVDARLVLARVLAARGDQERALEERLAAGELARAIGDRLLVLASLVDLGRSYEALGYATEARERTELALDVAVRLPDVRRARALLERLVELSGREGRPDLAARYRGSLRDLETPTGSGATTSPLPRHPTAPAPGTL